MFSERIREPLAVARLDGFEQRAMPRSGGGERAAVTRLPQFLPMRVQDAPLQDLLERAETGKAEDRHVKFGVEFGQRIRIARFGGAIHVALQIVEGSDVLGL